MGEVSVGGTIRVGLLDDHMVVAASIGRVLSDDYPDLDLVWWGVEYSALSDSIAAGLEMDVCVLDVMLGAGNPAAAVVARELTELGVACVLLSMLTGGAALRDALIEGGASGYVCKSASADYLAQAIREVAGGGLMLDGLAPVVAGKFTMPRLSDRERQVMVMSAQGLPLKVIAHRLSVTENTCNEYLKRVRRKYAQSGRTVRTKGEMLRAAVEDGLINLELWPQEHEE
jgi:DNA-binding NarL/FixJ family response regulator